MAAIFTSRFYREFSAAPSASYLLFSTETGIITVPPSFTHPFYFLLFYGIKELLTLKNSLSSGGPSLTP